MKIIVTGATGFVGKWLVNELLAQKDEVTVIVKNKEKVPAEWKGTVHVVEASLEQFCRLEQRDFPNGGADILFHLAWSGVSGAKRADVPLQVQNLQYTYDCVELAQRLGCDRFVNAGSIMEYEAMAYIPMEKTEPGMGNVYSTAKLAADFIAKTAAVDKGMEYINLIISNIYGAGEFSERFLNTVLRKMLNHEPIPLTHGEQLYDFIYVSDAVKAMALAGKKGEKNSAYYIGNRKQFPLKCFIQKMKEALESESELQFGKVPFRGIMLNYNEFDTGKMESLGFKPEIDFETGVRMTKMWMEKIMTDFKVENLGGGVKIITPFFIQDERGYFLKSMEKDIFSAWELPAEFQEEFESYSIRGVIRGLHFQTKDPQIKLVRVIKGRIHDVIVDLRKDSLDFGKYRDVILDDKEHKSLWIPAGFAHGFEVLSDEAFVSYQCVGRYRKEFDAGICWNDSEIAVKWETKNPIVSEKDAGLMTFREFAEKYEGL